MTLKVQHLLFGEILAAIDGRVDLEEYLSSIYPKFSSRIRVGAFNTSELEDIRSKIRNYECSLFHNLTIAIRLCGGIGEAAAQSSLSVDEFTALLYSSNSELHRALAAEFVNSKLVSVDFFENPRPFFTDRQVARFRRINLARVMALATDYHALYAGLCEALSPHQDALHSLQQGVPCHRASWACRQIERVTGGPIGSLDRHPTSRL